MNLETILQMQKDRSNGVILCRPSIDQLIGHALMREIEAPKLQAKIEQLEADLAQMTALYKMATGKDDSHAK